MSIMRQFSNWRALIRPAAIVWGVLLAVVAVGLTGGPAAQQAFAQPKKGDTKKGPEKKEEPKAESSDAAKTDFATAAGIQNSGDFKNGAAEWELFLKKHTGDPLAAKAQHYLGVCRVQLK